MSGLGGCLAVIAVSWAADHDVVIKGLKITVESSFDIDGVLEKSDVRPGLLDITVKYDVDSDSPREQIEKLIEHIERICPARDTLLNGTQVVHEL